jgi:glucose/arabinose dehydrogenase
MKPLPIFSVALFASLSAGALVLNSCGDDSPAVVTDAMPGAVIDAADVPVIDAAIAQFCTPTSGTSLVLQEIVSGLTEPLFLDAPKGDERLFIVEQSGKIMVVKGGELLPTAFLDIEGSVSGGNEQGLLGLAFHPDFATNGRFFVNYTDNAGDTVVAEYTATGGADVANATGKILLTIDQPQSNHNGGMIAFGADGYLYIGSGDGGGGGDQHGAIGNGQDLNTNLGKLLRIDIDSGDPYAIPADNPYAGGGGSPEIWAYGLRNPWRYSFDSMTGEVYIADVGQGPNNNPLEEVNVQAGATANVNYGWRIMEGTQCFLPSSGCDMGGKVLPVHTYPHDQGRASITGGYVYRGSCLPDIQGRYFFGDYAGTQIYSFEHAAGAITNLQDLTSTLDPNGDINRLTSFGEDGFGELYVVSRNGRIFRIVAGS